MKWRMQRASWNPELANGSRHMAYLMATWPPSANAR